MWGFNYTVFHCLKTKMGVGGEQRGRVDGWGQDTLPWLVCSESFLLTQPRWGLGSVGEGAVPSPTFFFLSCFQTLGLVPTGWTHPGPFKSYSVHEAYSEAVLRPYHQSWSGTRARVKPQTTTVWLFFHTSHGLPLTLFLLFKRFNMLYLDIPSKYKI